MFFAGCTKVPGVRTVYYTYENNTGHTVELLTGNGSYEMYAEIPDGESATFVYHGSDDHRVYRVFTATIGYVFFDNLKVRVDHKYIRVWNFWDHNGFKYPHNPGFDFRKSTRTDFLDFKLLECPCQCAQKKSGGNNTYYNGIIHRKIALDERYYLDTKLNFFYIHKFNSDVEQPWVLFDGEYCYDDTIFAGWEKGSTWYQEYLKLSNEDFEKDIEDALANMANRKICRNVRI